MNPEMDPVPEMIRHSVFDVISEIAAESGEDAYVVGGYVRDSFLGRPCMDIDIVVVGDGIAMARRVGEKYGIQGKVAVFRNFGTAMIRLPGDEAMQIEFVGARKESYRSNSRKPDVKPGTLLDDLLRRDFTINSLAVSLNATDRGKLIDPFDGVHDIHARIIRTPRDPDITFSDDPLRMLRAIRFASQLRFDIHPSIRESILRNRQRMEILSMERVSEELNKMIMAPIPSAGFRLLEETGLLPVILPWLEELKGVETIEGKGHKDNYRHTLQVLDNVASHSDDLWLRWAALLHDVAKPATRRFEPGTGWTFHGHEFLGAKMVPGIFKKLKLPLHEKMKYVQKMILLHLRPIALSEDHVTDSAVRRLLFEAGDDIEDLILLCEADITSKNISKVRKHLRNFEIVRQKLVEIELKDRVRNWQPPITGEIIMKTFGIKPGKEVGILKNAIREAILDGVVRNDFNEAYRFMIEKAKSMGLIPIVTEHPADGEEM
ncbi:MAG: HD domain-containing protein [Bacteroidales bacterium]|nr:HD domain-containing protein [Bacteroidales bacterium]